MWKASYAPGDGQTSRAYPFNPVQYLDVSCYVTANKQVLSYLLLRLLPQFEFYLILFFISLYVLSPIRFVQRYVLSPINFVADTFCRLYILSPICFVADMFCRRYVFGRYVLFRYVLSRYVLSLYKILPCLRRQTIFRT